MDAADDPRRRARHVPVRTCVGCRRKGSRSDLLRVVLLRHDGGVPVVTADAGRRAQGRGAWLHPDPACLDLALRRRAFARALRHQGPVDAAGLAESLGLVPKQDEQ